MRAAKLIPEYVRLLAREVAQTGAIAKSVGTAAGDCLFRRRHATTLTAEQLDILLRAVEEHFDLSAIREYTVEAGRPDTVTEEKFRVLRAHGVSRISINPQTLQDAVLQSIGRRHTAGQFTTPLTWRGGAASTISTPISSARPARRYRRRLFHSLDGIISLEPESL